MYASSHWNQSRWKPATATAAASSRHSATLRRDTPLPRAHLHGLADAVEHAPQLVVVGVLHAHPGVGHVAGLDALRRRARRREVRVDHPAAELLLQRFLAVVAGDRAVAVGAQRAPAGAEPAARALAYAAEHDRLGPGAVEVELVGGAVEVPDADAGRPAADLGDTQPLLAG